MNCRDRISDRCVQKTNAVCTTYEGTLSSKSGLTASPCLNLEDVIEDINTQLNNLEAEVDVHLLSNDTCITYPEVDGVVTAKEAILTLNTRVKALMDFVGMQCDGSSSSDCPIVYSQAIECVGLNFGTLVDACGHQPANLKEVLQLILTKIQP